MDYYGFIPIFVQDALDLMSPILSQLHRLVLGTLSLLE